VCRFAKKGDEAQPAHRSYHEPHRATRDWTGPGEGKTAMGQEKAQGLGEVDEKGFCAKSMSRLDRRFFFFHLWFPLGLFAALVLLFETTDLDLRLSDLFFDSNQHLFFWKNTWWATSLIHSGGKLFVAGVWVSLLFCLVVSFLRWSLPRLRAWRAALLFLVLGMISGPATVGCLKLFVNRPYPEHIKRYGGPLEYTKIFQGAPPTNRHYKGFPAGHASAGYGLMGLYFVFREKRPRLAPWGLVFGLALGTLFAFGQHVRGLHYASHNVWSAAICWFEALALYLWLFRKRLAGMASRPGVIHPAPVSSVSRKQ
jgi:membrane-associated PAP2 superfamily phosphatase